MSTSIVNSLKNKLIEHGLTAYSLEKRGKLKSNAIHNILSGRSKNPSITLIQSIAKTLNCSVSELINDQSSNTADEIQLVKGVPHKVNHDSVAIKNDELYIKCLFYLCTILKKSNNWLKKEQLLDYVDEIYSYSERKGENKVDTIFAEWLIEKVVK